MSVSKPALRFEAGPEEADREEKNGNPLPGSADLESVLFVKQPHDHLITDHDLPHVFALSYLRGTVLHFFCRTCRSEVSQKSHPMAAEQLIDFFNHGVSTRLLIYNGSLKPEVVKKQDAS